MVSYWLLLVVSLTDWFDSTYHSLTVTSMIPSPMSDSLNWTMGPRNTAHKHTQLVGE